MKQISAEFAAALGGQHTAVVEVEVTGPDGTGTSLPIIDGSVTLDATSATRGACDLTIVDDGTLGLVPAAAGELLTPYGSELRVRRGVRLAGGDELVSLGIFGVDTVEVADTGDNLELHVTGMDRSARIADAKLESPTQIPKGTLFTDAILQIVSEVMEVLVNFSASYSSNVTPQDLWWEEGTDRWEIVQDLALGVASEIYFDGDGVLTLRSVGQSEPQWTITDGDQGTLIEVSKSWAREGIYNRVIVTGENSSGSQSFRGVATDDDPASPTRYDGPFGRVPRLESYDFIASNNQALQTAQILLDKRLGLAQGVSFSCAVNPALEPDDVVRIIRERAKIDETHVLDSVTIPLAADQPMSGATRLLAST